MKVPSQIIILKVLSQRDVLISCKREKSREFISEDLPVPDIIPKKKSSAIASLWACNTSEMVTESEDILPPKRTPFLSLHRGPFHCYNKCAKQGGPKECLLCCKICAGTLEAGLGSES